MLWTRQAHGVWDSFFSRCCLQERKDPEYPPTMHLTRFSSNAPCNEDLLCVQTIDGWNSPPPERCMSAGLHRNQTKSFFPRPVLDLGMPVAQACKTVAVSATAADAQHRLPSRNRIRQSRRGFSHWDQQTAECLSLDWSASSAIDAWLSAPSSWQGNRRAAKGCRMASRSSRCSVHSALVGQKHNARHQ